MSMFRRRLMMMQGAEPAWQLIHDWRGEDAVYTGASGAPQNGYIRDRVRGIDGVGPINWALWNIVDVTPGQCKFTPASAGLNAASSRGTQIWGSVWKVVFRFTEYVDNGTAAKPNFFFDFSSVRGVAANSATFCLGFSGGEYMTNTKLYDNSQRRIPLLYQSYSSVVEGEMGINSADGLTGTAYLRVNGQAVEGNQFAIKKVGSEVIFGSSGDLYLARAVSGNTFTFPTYKFDYIKIYRNINYL